MADIDKGLPNVKRPEDEVVTENFEEVDVAEELGKGPVEITEDETGATIDFESMFYNPEAYNIYAFDNVWDEGSSGTTCGFFHPSFQNLVGFMDKDGNSLEDKACLMFKKASSGKKFSINFIVD